MHTLYRENPDGMGWKNICSFNLVPSKLLLPCNQNLWNLNCFSAVLGLCDADLDWRSQNTRWSRKILGHHCWHNESFKWKFRANRCCNTSQECFVFSCILARALSFPGQCQRQKMWLKHQSFASGFAETDIDSGGFLVTVLITDPLRYQRVWPHWGRSISVARD